MSMLAYADVITLAASDGTPLRFDRSEYDERVDRLQLSYGPDQPVAARPTPEGHVLHVAPAGDEVCGLVLTNVRECLERDGYVEATLAPEQRVHLDAAEVAALVSRPGARTAPRFARLATAPFR